MPHLYTLPQLKGMMSEPNRKSLGQLGEITVARLLEERGYQVSFAHCGERRGDLRAVRPNTGEVLHIEVKTARRGRDKKWRFTLVKDGATDHRDSDMVILVAVHLSGEVTFFTIPVVAIAQRRAIVISSHPQQYQGCFAEYRGLDL